MPKLQTYPRGTLPPHIKWQITSFTRIQWPFIFEDDPYWDYYTGKDMLEASVVLVEGDLLISHAEANQRTLIHNGITHKVYGVSGVFTYPAHQGKGYGRQIVDAVTATIDGTDADVAILFCAPKHVDFYAAGGWQWMQTPVKFGDPANPQTDDYGQLMMRFVSEQGQRAQADFQQMPVYVGWFTW